MTVRLSGLTWDHPRGYRVLDALAGALEPDVSVQWQRQPLEGFESRPLRTLADDFDLLVVDHPGLGEAIRDGALLPLDEVFGEAGTGCLAGRVGGRVLRQLRAGRPAVGAAAGRRRPGRGGPARPDGGAARHLGAGLPGGPGLHDHAVPGRPARAADVQRDLRGGRITTGGGPMALASRDRVSGRGRTVCERGGGHGRPRGHGGPAGLRRPRAVPAQPDRRAGRDGGQRRTRPTARWSTGT